MSFFSLVKFVFAFFVLPYVFFFHPFKLLLLLLFWMVVFVKLVGSDLCTISVYRRVGFWLFLLSEAIVFCSLLVSCLWFQGMDSSALAYAYFMPLIETVLLVGSSFFISAYHCLASSEDGKVYLGFTLFMSLMFLMLAGYEILGSNVSSLYSPHSACCYLVVGLHFSHVLMGSLLLVQLLFFVVFDFVRRNSHMYVVYWHFVDYVWLFVFTVVYLLV